MARTVLELKCMKCDTRFEKSFERKRNDSDFTKGELVRLEGTTCPNKCGGDWFSVEKQHTIRKFKWRY